MSHAAEAAAEAEPAAKKQKTDGIPSLFQKTEDNEVMQSHEANLEIDVGGDGKEGGDKTTTRFYNSAVLANKSKYIDTMLASPMKESETHKISFKDTPIEVFDCALKCLKASEARKMTAKDVITVAKFYDQYDFAEGQHLCNQVLLEYFESLPQQEKYFSLDVDMLVEAVVVSKIANLTQAYEKGRDYIKAKMTDAAFPNCGVFKDTMFNRRHIEKLVPVLAELVEEDNTFLNWVAGKKGIDKQTIQSPLFPALFTTASSHVHAMRRLAEGGRIRVTGSGISNADGDYVKDENASFSRRCRIKLNGVLYQKIYVKYFHPMATSPGWRIGVQKNERFHIFWKAKYSAGLSLPPKDNWEPAHRCFAGRSLKDTVPPYISDSAVLVCFVVTSSCIFMFMALSSTKEGTSRSICMRRRSPGGTKVLVVSFSNGASSPLFFVLLFFQLCSFSRRCRIRFSGVLCEKIYVKYFHPVAAGWKME